MKPNQFLLLVSLILAPLAVHAVRVPGLYEAEVPVDSQQAGSRQQAIEAAMKIILIKLTGDRNAPSRPGLAPLIRTAERYVQQYRYVEAEQPVTADPLGSEVQLRLKIGFDESNLNDWLHEAGVQIWGRERPSTLIWLAMEKDRQRKLLIPEEEPQYLAAVNRQADARGIVLMYPLFDLQDTSSLQAGDIRAGFQDAVKNASARYYPDTVLTGWLESPLEGIWEAHWTAYIGEERRSWMTEGSYPETALVEGIDGMADLLTERFGAQAGAGTAEITMKVLDVSTAGHYARVLDYLESLSAVSRVEVIEVNPGDIEFRLLAHGGDAAVRQAISFGRVLEPVAANNNMYRFLP